MSATTQSRCAATPDMFAPVTDAEKAMVPTVLGETTTETWEPMLPAPSEPEPPNGATAMWVYRDASGNPLYARFRFEKTDDAGFVSKEVRPLTYGRRVWVDRNGRQRDLTGWHWKQPAKPLPLYGLDRLAAHPGASVLLVEGEKTADAAGDLFPDYVAVTSGGSTSASSVSWASLSGRAVTIWPDNDEPGQKYAQACVEALREAGAQAVRVVKLPDNLPEGWDLADPYPAEDEQDTGALLRTLIERAPQAEANVTMPYGYSLTKSGLFYTPEAKDDNLPLPVWVAAPFEVIAETRDENGTGWGLLIRWRDRDGNPHQWSLPKRLVHGEGKDIAGELEDAGLNCSITAQRHLRQFIASVRTHTRLRCVTNAGWHKTELGPAFVLPNGITLGEGRRAVAFQTTSAATGTEYATAGTLEEWKRDIAAYAVGNSRLLFALSIPFCGPLLDIMGEQSGGFHIVGKSQSGKSTALFAAGSVWGKGDRDGQVRSWRGTSNGTEGIAAATSDTLLILDEMSQADSREVGEITYMLANNTGKQRAGRNGEARTRKTWRSSFLSTGEVTLAVKMGETGRRTMAGQEVRLVSIQADAGAGMGMFETLHDMPSAGDLADHIRRAARTTYGTASRAYLDALVKDRTADEAGLIAGIKSMVDAFADMCLPNVKIDGQVRSVVRRFGLVAAAGEMAAAYDILPWQRDTAIQAAKICFESWLSERGGTQAAEDREAIEQVRAFIEAHGESRFTNLNRADEGGLHSRTNNRAGYRRVEDGPDDGRWEYLIFPEAWRKEVCKGLDAKRAAKVLYEAGHLTAGDPGRTTKSVRIPEEGLKRFYVLRNSILEGGAA
ncbi:DUF927 domain-containing protein [Acetobacter orientalis]|uniref:DUF927 domain-containing protein n=1 Tax=Acetobacter orientalis TaxID=146474 RepID=UPI00209E24AB|nr:DUF927 domain-containing protein [Acetobacter orientalis]MCP1214624.1 DUF927 domain-containing protein [Acetobacter orientalis]MCP1218207.1 DUF927 domain-containing protein [Acetobacter orientalis]